jgi:hypothetical protein
MVCRFFMSINQLNDLKRNIAPKPNINNTANPIHHKKALFVNNTPPLSGTPGAAAVGVVWGVGDCTTTVLVTVAAAGSVAWGNIEVAVGVVTGASVDG